VPETSPDRELAARLVAGDESALREAYRAHAPAVHGLALRVLANEALAEDVVQDVFVRLWEQPERFDVSRGPIRSFLLSMTHSRAVERVRSEASQQRRRSELGRQPARAADDPARLLETEEAQLAVRSALAELPDSQRRPIEMAYFDGLSYRDVARQLNEAEGTVKYRIRMGMQKLRAALRAVEVMP
jgi:RNA polymerase sigma-70 factor (ECF subfamily)